MMRRLEERVRGGSVKRLRQQNEYARPGARREGARRSKRGTQNGVPTTTATLAHNDAALDDMRRELENVQAIPSSQTGTSTVQRELSPVTARESNKLVLRLDPPPQCCYQC